MPDLGHSGACRARNAALGSSGGDYDCICSGVGLSDDRPIRYRREPMTCDFCGRRFTAYFIAGPHQGGSPASIAELQDIGWHSGDGRHFCSKDHAHKAGYDTRPPLRRRNER